MWGRTPASAQTVAARRMWPPLSAAEVPRPGKYRVAVKAIGWLRVSPEGEVQGLDIHEHGAPAYHPEYAYMGYSPMPAGVGSGAGLPSGVSPPAGEEE